MRFLKKILLTAAVLSIVFSMGFISGCMTIKGIASDVEEISGALNRGLEPMEESRRQARLDRAASMVIDSEGSK